MTLAEVTPVIEVAIHQAIIIDGKTWEAVASEHGLSVSEVREVFARADAVAQARNGSNAESWRNSITHICLDVAAQAQESFEKSKRGRVKKKFKDGKLVEEIREEDSSGDPRLLNTRLNAAVTIAQIQIPKLPQQFNVNTRSQHDITVKLESMTDEELEGVAMLAKLEQDGILLIDQSDFKRIEHQPDFKIIEQQPPKTESEAKVESGN